jgi:hypothetical protein
MSDRVLNRMHGAQGLLSRVPTEMSEEEKKKAGVAASVQRGPMDQITCRAGDASCAMAHTRTLSRSMASEPAGAQSVLQLQRGFGNKYVQKVVSMTGKSSG